MSTPRSGLVPPQRRRRPASRTRTPSPATGAGESRTKRWRWSRTEADTRAAGRETGRKPFYTGTRPRTLLQFFLFAPCGEAGRRGERGEVPPRASGGAARCWQPCSPWQPSYGWRPRPPPAWRSAPSWTKADPGNLDPGSEAQKPALRPGPRRPAPAPPAASSRPGRGGDREGRGRGLGTLCSTQGG